MDMNQDTMLPMDELSMEAALPLYDIYRRNFTLFKARFLESPVMHDLSRITVPKYSTYHYVDMSGLSTGPQYSDSLLQAAPGIKAIEHVRQLWKPEGTPIKVPDVNQELLITEYKRFNRMIRPTLDPSKMEKDERGLLIYNYSLLPRTWRYAQNFRSEYTRWSNVYRTIYHKLTEVAAGSDRHQFLDMSLPDRIPSLGKLREFARSKSSESLKYLRMDGDLLVADMFLYLGEQREESLLSMIPEDQRRKINFIVRKNSSWVVINLGWLEQMRAMPGMVPKLMQTKFLLMLNRLSDIASLLQVDDEEHHEVPKPAEQTVDQDDELSKVDEEEIDEISSVLSGGYIDDHDDSAGLVDDVAELSKAEKELEELDRIRETASAETMFDEDEHHPDVVRFDVDGFNHGGEKGSAIVNKADELLSKNNITPAAYKRLLRASDRFSSIPDPYGSDKPLVEAMIISDDEFKVEEKVITTDKVVNDPALTVSKVDSYHEKYIRHGLKKDIMSVMSSFQNFPVAVTDYKVFDKTDSTNTIEEHVVKIVPAVGESSTVRMPTFKLKEDGTFMYSGKTYRMRLTRRDLPIRKISPTEVVLSSYAGKCFVRRSDRSKFNYGKWVKSYLTEHATDVDSTLFKNAVLSTVVNYQVKLPLIYTTIASVLSSFEIGNIHYTFDYKKRVEILGLTQDDLKLEKRGSVIIAKENGIVYLLKEDGEIVTVKDGIEDPFDDMESLLKMNGKKPLPMAELKVYGKSIPVGVCLGYLIGLGPLLKLLRARVRRSLPGERLALEEHEYVLRFKNENLILDSRDRKATLVMAGWTQIENVIKQYDIALFDNPDVYMPLLERSGIPSRYLRELDAFNAGFIDPMTKNLLMNMGEPTEYAPLVARAVELILDEYVPTKRDDPKEMIELTERLCGYERIPGMMYESIFKAMRQYAAKANRSDAKVVVNPQEALTWIITDPTTSTVNNINPIHSLREREVVTFGGRYGRSKKAMVARTRLYAEEDKGFISEATVDSGDVGVITYLTPNANITSIRGTIRLFDAKKDSNTALLSTPSQLMPGADGDVPKRMAFISVQIGHQISTAEKDVQPYRTGGERSMIGRLSKEFGAVAKGEGKVTELDDKHIVIEYKDGRVDRYQIGNIEVSAEGTYYPHVLKTHLTLGSKVKPGDVVFYNANFFKPSELDKGAVDYSLGALCFTAFREANYTIEDSCAISEKFANRMRTVVTKVKSKVVNFDQEVIDILKPGAKVDLDSPLFKIQDGLVGDMDQDELAKALSRYSTHVLKAGVVGTVNRVEVFYNGMLEEMSESLRKLTDQTEKHRKEECKHRGEDFHPNQVTRFVRIDGHQVESKQAIVVYHISLELGMSVSDKLVFASQLKSTVGQVLFGNNTTLEGEELDAIFGALSGINRTVTSVYKQGGVNTFLRYVGEEAYKLWKG